MQKTEIPGLYKESEGVLINADKEALMNYKKRRELLLAKDKRINTLETRMDKISEDMEEIKSLLRKLTKE
jgi:chaperonin cofactor prefoldin